MEQREGGGSGRTVRFSLRWFLKAREKEGEKEEEEDDLFKISSRQYLGARENLDTLFPPCVLDVSQC